MDMSFPMMGLCPDKRGFCFLNKKKKTTMSDKGGVVVYASSNGCSTETMNHQEPKMETFYPPYSTRKLIASFNSFKVGRVTVTNSRFGQRLDTIHLGSIPDLYFVPKLVDAVIEQFGFSSAPSPPRKKFAREENIQNLSHSEFPSVITKEPSQEHCLDAQKQSYAEVAKTTNIKSSKPEGHSIGKVLTETKFSRKGSSCHRRSLSTCQKNSRRKPNRRDRRDSISSNTSGSDCLGSVSEIQKDLRPNHHEKHISHPKTVGHEKNFSRRGTPSNFSSCNRRDQPAKERHPEGRHHVKHHTQHRSHCDNKKSFRSRNFNCDIDTINWRTGEPIPSMMGPECNQDDCGDDPHLEQTSMETLTANQSNVDCLGEPKNHELPSTDSVPWPEAAPSPRCRRRSLSSECSVDSEDSFIVFQSGAGAEGSVSDIASDYSDFDSDDSYESDSESSNEDDFCDGLYQSPARLRLKEVNDLWKQEYQQVPSDNKLQQGSKKVRFSNSKPTVHKMLAWDFAYRTSRLGPWEQMARDRDRFQSRIHMLEDIISPVLDANHRSNVWKSLHATKT